jgi:hypothetical protein
MPVYTTKSDVVAPRFQSLEKSKGRDAHLTEIAPPQLAFALDASSSITHCLAAPFLPGLVQASLGRSYSSIRACSADCRRRRWGLAET